MPSFFPVLILNARPAAGKSETIHFLEQIPVVERIRHFHIGPVQTFDDFPMLWAWFEEDDILERTFQRSRLHTTPARYFIYNDLWHLLIRRLSLDYAKWRRDVQEEHTAVFEFSRGSPSGGYQAAYQHLSEDILRQAACLYIRVSHGESVRKNRRRRSDERPDSILEHSLEDEKMERLYHDDDWQTFSAPDPNYLHLRGIQVPYVVFENEDDVTTRGGQALLGRLIEAFDQLWSLWKNHQAL